jgi:RNA polymerase sigma-70 factor (ECF subfamily)
MSGEAFAPTQWTVVLRAAGEDPTDAYAALSRLCETYWYPLYAYVRRRGYSVHDAQDLTQGFFAFLLRGKAVAGVDPVKGKFRAFLLASLNHFLAGEWDKTRAQKRGGGQVIAFDLAWAETRLAAQPANGLTPERLFEQRWALTLLESVYQRLRLDYELTGKAALFDALRFTLTGTETGASYCELAKELAMGEGALKVAAHRLRKQYRALLRKQIAETVASPDDVEEELRYLFRVLAE